MRLVDHEMNFAETERKNLLEMVSEDEYDVYQWEHCI
jgi:hypothetical protein